MGDCKTVVDWKAKVQFGVVLFGNASKGSSETNFVLDDNRIVVERTLVVSVSLQPRGKHSTKVLSSLFSPVAVDCMLHQILL